MSETDATEVVKKTPVYSRLHSGNALVNPKKIPDITERCTQTAKSFYEAFLGDEQPLGDTYDIVDPASHMLIAAYDTFATLDLLRGTKLAERASITYKEQVFDTFFQEMFPDEFFVDPAGAQYILMRTIKSAQDTYRYLEVMDINGGQ